MAEYTQKPPYETRAARAARAVRVVGQREHLRGERVFYGFYDYEGIPCVALGVSVGGAVALVGLGLGETKTALGGVLRDSVAPWRGIVLEAGLRREVLEQEPLKVCLVGSPFARRVWVELLALGPGARVSYGQLARRVGCDGGSRAVGQAVGRNPLAVVVPCHRVVRGTGALGGYRWGVALKARLLAGEAQPPAWGEIHTRAAPRS